MSTVTDEEFLIYSNPHSWLLVADDLHDQARTIYEARGTTSVTRHDTASGLKHRLDRVDRAVTLLLSFSLENLLKGLLLFVDPTHLQSGKLSKEMTTSHNLVRLSKLANMKLSHSASDALAIASEGMVSWARYPCALNLERSKDMPKLKVSFFKTLFQTFDRWRKMLMKMLSIGWSSHLGPFGRFLFSPNF